MEEVFIKNIIKKGLFRAETDAFLPFGGKGAILLEKVWIFAICRGDGASFWAENMQRALRRTKLRQRALMLMVRLCVRAGVRAWKSHG